MVSDAVRTRRQMIFNAVDAVVRSGKTSGRGGQRKPPNPDLVYTKDLAEYLGCSGRNIEKISRLLRSGHEDLIEAARAGVISLNALDEELKRRIDFQLGR